MAGLTHAQIGNIVANQLAREFSDIERDAIIFAIANAITENNKALERDILTTLSALDSRLAHLERGKR